MANLHEGFLLHTNPDAHILQPHNSDRSLLFDRKTGDIRLTQTTFKLAPGVAVANAGKQGKPVFGIFGIVPLPTADVLILVTSAKLHGKLFDAHPVYLASNFLLLPITTRESVHPVESELMSLISQHLGAAKLWFSYEWDLTRSLQATSKDQSSRPMWEKADDRFFWNKPLQSSLIYVAKTASDSEIDRFILPVLYGSFDLRSTTVQSQPVQLALISRRSRYRAGTRYYTRGVDANGNVGNFNESEQILIIPGKQAASFIQTRGSAPFYWSEIVNLIFVPDLIIMDRGEETRRAFRAHMEQQTKLYGRVVLLNLVKGRGREKLVKDAYEELAKGNDEKGLDGVRYEYFDLHSETHGGRWNRIDEEATRLEDELVGHGSYFQANVEAPTEPTKIQTGVVRSNCMDCLDRTNMMQTAIAKKVLDHQLHDLGLLSDDQKIDDEADLMSAFRNIWSDHANFIAQAYTGTGAQRTDFTRTGVRTRRGVIGDKWMSLWRYIMNNHVDGYKQDAFDLMTGVWDGQRDPTYVSMLLRDKRHWAVRLMPYIMAFALFMILATLFLPRYSSYPFLYPLAFWSSVFTISTAYVVHHPIDYVAWPRLNFQPTLDAIYYTGPGARTRKGSIGRAGKGVVQEVYQGEKTIIEEAIKAE